MCVDLCYVTVSVSQVINGGWNIADCVERAYDVERMHVGTVAAGRIGLAVLRRLAPFDCNLHYCDRHRLPAAVEKELNLTYHPSVEAMVKVCVCACVCGGSVSVVMSVGFPRVYCFAVCVWLFAVVVVMRGFVCVVAILCEIYTVVCECT